MRFSLLSRLVITEKLMIIINFFVQHVPNFVDNTNLNKNASVEQVFNDILLDMKLANSMHNDQEPECARMVIGSILIEAELKKV